MNTKKTLKTKLIYFMRNLPMRAVLITYSLLVIIPLLWVLMMSFKTNREILTDPWQMPQQLNFENYINAFNQAKMADYFLNSIMVVILGVVILLLIAVPAAYVLSRFTFKGSKTILNLYMAGIFVQGTYLMVPLFLQMMNFNMLDNRFWLSTVYSVMRFPFTIFLLSGFFKAIPHDYEEAATIDGASRLQTMWLVIVPMAKGGIVTAALLAGLGYWNEYPLALILIQSDAKRTLPIGLANLFEVQQYATDWGALFAGLVIAMIPSAILYLIGHKKLTTGLSVGGLKG